MNKEEQIAKLEAQLKELRAKKKAERKKLLRDIERAKELIKEHPSEFYEVAKEVYHFE